MKLRVYSIFDRKAEVFNAPMCFVNDAIAKRALAQIIPNDADMSKFPEDFDVYYIGDFYNDAGHLMQGASNGPDSIEIAFRLSDLFQQPTQEK